MENDRKKPSFDERQLIARGKAFEGGFWAMMGFRLQIVKIFIAT